MMDLGRYRLGLLIAMAELVLIVVAPRVEGPIDRDGRRVGRPTANGERVSLEGYRLHSHRWAFPLLDLPRPELAVRIAAPGVHLARG